jgi:hypothetical protein
MPIFFSQYFCDIRISDQALSPAQFLQTRTSNTPATVGMVLTFE